MAFAELNAQPVINSTTELAEWDAFVAAQNWRGGAAIHVDTGMNRLGISPDEAAALAPRVQSENHGITLLMSHLACAEIADHPLNASQIRLFRELRMLYHGIPASLANSSGIFLGEPAHFDLARPGAALYGVNPTPGQANPMRDVVELTGRILHGAQSGARRDRRLWRGLDGKPRLAHRRCRGGLCRWIAARRKRHRPQSRAARRSSPPSAARSSATSRWIWSASMSPILPTDRFTAATAQFSSARTSRSTRSPPPPARSATKSWSGSARVAISSIAAVENGSMVARAQNFVCQKLRRRLGALGGPLRRLRRLEYAGRGRRCHARRRSSRKGRLFVIEPLKGETLEAPRLASGIAEFDRVTGGGLVRGSVLLLGGDPGIGKSTLLIEVAAAFAAAAPRAVYISGEEAVAQVRLRAERLGLADAAVELAAETSVEDIVATLSQAKVPQLLVIDSIQTMWTQTVESAPGTVTQVRGSAGELIRFAKRTGAAVILVGHVTKDGQIAGPRVVEHMVDAVLSFEGEGSQQFRILRAIKNRFGPTDEIGVFEMTGAGLREVANPSELFLSERDLGSPGTAVFAGIEGTRPLLVEIQALVAPTSLGTPRRAVVGWDPSRLSMVLAVLEAHCGVRLSGHDVYLNVAGGLRIQEPAADVAAAAALVSSLARAPLPADAVYFGEASLSGAVRPVAQTAARLKEAQKLGFGRAIAPEAARDEAPDGFALSTIGTLADLVADIARDGMPAQKRAGGQDG